MLYRLLSGLRGAMMAFAVVLLGFSQTSAADDSDRHGADRSAATDGWDTTSNVEVVTTNSANERDSEVIEEIVVVATKNRRRPKLDQNLGSDPVLANPKRLDWQFFPVYDSEQAPREVGSYEIDRSIRRTGLIEVFRIRF